MAAELGAFPCRSMRVAPRRCLTRSPFRWMAPTATPTPRSAGSTPLTKSVKASVPLPRPVPGYGTVRVTLQHANFRELARFVDLVRDSGARQISFLAVDVANPHAFGRADDFTSDLALTNEELPEFSRLLDALERDHAEDFRRGFIAESPRKLRRLAQYFAAVRGQGSYPAVRCNAPEYSAVIDARANVRPCFFIPGTAEGTLGAAGALEAALNEPTMAALRAEIRTGARPECSTCVCPLWRDAGSAATLLPAPTVALRGA